MAHLRRSKGITDFIGCKVLHGGLRKWDSALRQEGADGVEFTRLPIKSAKIKKQYYLDRPTVTCKSIHSIFSVY